MASAERDGVRLISVVLGASDDETRSRESQRLLSYGFRYYDTQTLFKSGEIIESSVKVWFGKEDFIDLTIKDNATITFPRGAEDNIKAIVSIDDTLEAPISPGDKLGTLEIVLDDETLLSVPLISVDEIQKGNIITRLLDWLVLFFTNLLS